MRKLFLSTVLGAASAVTCIPIALSNPQPLPAPSKITTPIEKPSLTAEQRMEFAKARDRIQSDPEYAAAVQRVVLAQKAADNLYFNKLLAAAPQLSDYIRYMQQARGLGQDQTQR
jgi:hypothetical protein